jgi:hypothetical protein
MSGSGLLLILLIPLIQVTLSLARWNQTSMPQGGTVHRLEA